MPKQPPLFSKVVFVDWHGVMSQDPFWKSIRSCDGHHRLQALLDEQVGAVLSDKVEAARWMTGTLSTREVAQRIGRLTRPPYTVDFLLRRVIDDCARMTVNGELVSVLHSFASRTTLVVATDNTDCFADTFRQRAERRHHGPEGISTLAAAAWLFDDLVCSSDVGALKAEDPRRFFGGWLAERGLTFADAALLDDRADNCAVFSACGGTALRWRLGDPVSTVVAWLERWLDGPAGAVA